MHPHVTWRRDSVAAAAEAQRVDDARGQLAGRGIAESPSQTAGEDLRERLAALLDTDRGALDTAEQTLIDLALEQAGGNLAQAARQLGISRRQLAYRLEKRATGQVQDQESIGT